MEPIIDFGVTATQQLLEESGRPARCGRPARQLAPKSAECPWRQLGNEHDRATFLRNNNLGNTFDSEIACPGAANGAITVGALTKQTFLAASFSSRGPTAFQSAKPDIAAPGVNITSSIPARRQADGIVVPNLTRAELSDRDSGTSMATPIVSGALALILQRRIADGQPTDAASIRTELLTKGFQVLARPVAEVGIGRLNIGGL